VQEHGGEARLDIYVAAEALAEDEGNGAVRVEDAGHTRSAAEAAADRFLDFCARRGITTSVVCAEAP
jgi:hypothetical protein